MANKKTSCEQDDGQEAQVKDFDRDPSHRVSDDLKSLFKKLNLLLKKLNPLLKKLNLSWGETKILF